MIEVILPRAEFHLWILLENRHCSETLAYLTVFPTTWENRKAAQDLRGANSLLGRYYDMAPGLERT